MIDAVIWTVVGFGAATVSSHLSSAAWLAPWQALTPWLVAPSFPLGVYALFTGRWWPAAVAAAAVLTVLWLAPRRRSRSEPPPGPQLRVLYGNVKFDQSTPQCAARALLDAVIEHDADVLAASEVTVTFAEALTAGGIEGLLPHRVGEPVIGPEASVIWTRRSVVAVGEPGPGPTWDADATLDLGDALVRIIATHPLPPVGADMRPHWKPGLASTAERARRPGPAVLVVGDLNACRWHRAWRTFVGRDFVSAHEALGRGWSSSWPADRRIPPFVRLDHALCGQGLHPVKIQDVSLPGSDHRGFVVTVAIVEANARTARPR